MISSSLHGFSPYPLVRHPFIASPRCTTWHSPLHDHHYHANFQVVPNIYPRPKLKSSNKHSPSNPALKQAQIHASQSSYHPTPSWLHSRFSPNHHHHSKTSNPNNRKEVPAFDTALDERSLAASTGQYSRVKRDASGSNGDVATRIEKFITGWMSGQRRVERGEEGVAPVLRPRGAVRWRMG